MTIVRFLVVCMTKDNWVLYHTMQTKIASQ